MIILIHSRALLAAILSHDRLAAVQASHSLILKPLLRFCLAAKKKNLGRDLKQGYWQVTQPSGSATERGQFENT